MRHAVRRSMTRGADGMEEDNGSLIKIKKKEFAHVGNNT